MQRVVIGTATDLSFRIGGGSTLGIVQNIVVHVQKKIGVKSTWNRRHLVPRTVEQALKQEKIIWRLSGQKENKKYCFAKVRGE